MNELQYKINKIIETIEMSRSKKDNYEISVFNVEKYFPENRCENELRWLMCNSNIGYYHELQGNPIKVFIKRVIRKLIRACIEPSLQDISNYNYNVAITMINMHNELIKATKKIYEQEIEIMKLAEKVK